MDAQTKKRIAAVRHLGTLADAVESGKELQFLFYERKVDGWGSVSDFPSDLDNDAILTHWRVKPAKKYRAWLKKSEAPAFFMARRHEETAVRAYAVKSDNHAVWHGGPGDAQAFRSHLCALFETSVRVLGDGSEVPCGVEVAE